MVMPPGAPSFFPSASKLLRGSHTHRPGLPNHPPALIRTGAAKGVTSNWLNSLSSWGLGLDPTEAMPGGAAEVELCIEWQVEDQAKEPIQDPPQGRDQPSPLCGYSHKGSGLVAVAVARSPGLPLAAAAGGVSLLFRQLFDGDTGTFTYLLADVPAAWPAISQELPAARPMPAKSWWPNSDRS